MENNAGKSFFPNFINKTRTFQPDDAFLFVRRYWKLSDGQNYRFKVAKVVEAGRQYWIFDEFCSVLDRDIAKIVAYNMQKPEKPEKQYW